MMKMRPCLMSTAVSLNPFARAVVMNSECNVVVIPSRISRAIRPEKYKPVIGDARQQQAGRHAEPLSERA